MISPQAKAESEKIAVHPMEKKNKIQESMHWGAASAVGIEIALSIVIGAVGGFYLDKWLNTSPIFTVVGLIAGMGAAVKAIIRVNRIYSQSDEGEEEEENSRGKSNGKPH